MAEFEKKIVIISEERDKERRTRRNYRDYKIFVLIQSFEMAKGVKRQQGFTAAEEQLLAVLIVLMIL